MIASRFGRTLVGLVLTAALGAMGAMPASAGTAPVITWIGAIPDGATFVFGQVPAAPSCTAADDLGSVPCVVTGYDTTVGVHVLTATATATDLTQAVETRTYTVQAWTLKGFFRPVKMGPGVWNKAKAGSAVPFRFKVYEGTVKARSVKVVTGFVAQQVSCTDLSVIGAPVPVAGRQKGFQLKYHEGAFHQNWKTPKIAKTGKGKKPAPVAACYQVTMTTADASTLSALFWLK